MSWDREASRMAEAISPYAKMDIMRLAKDYIAEVRENMGEVDGSISFPLHGILWIVRYFSNQAPIVSI